MSESVIHKLTDEFMNKRTLDKSNINYSRKLHEPMNEWIAVKLEQINS